MVNTRFPPRYGVTVHFAGGLGNQLFQLAYFLYQKELGVKIVGEYGTLPIRASATGKPWFQEICSVDVELKKTPRLKKLIFSAFIILVMKTSGRSLRSKKNFTLLKKHFAVNHILNAHVVTEVGYEPNSTYPSAGNVFAYFQTDYWVKQFDLKKYLKYSKLGPDVYALAKIEKPLIVHVRIGDYSENPQLGILGSNYYQSSIRESFRNFAHGSIWLFSDTPKLALSRVPEELHHLVRFVDSPNDTPIETLEKMRLGSGYVLANSTLGWWGAYLSYNSTAQVISPNPWFKKLVEPNSLIPDNWIRRDADWE